MTQFASGRHGATQLFGSSKGYIGSESYGKLTSDLRDSPEAVVLLDEFEKAHPEVHKNFLTAWNDGFVTEASDGKHISTSAGDLYADHKRRDRCPRVRSAPRILSKPTSCGASP